VQINFVQFVITFWGRGGFKKTLLKTHPSDYPLFKSYEHYSVIIQNICVHKVQTDVSYVLVRNIYVIENVIELQPINILITLNEKDEKM
jgi:hypothetical protein